MASRVVVSLTGILLLCAVCRAAGNVDQSAREAVRKSLVLLKNGDEPKMALLPLEKKVIHILVAGSHAKNIALQSGQASNKGTSGTTILDGIKATVPETTKVTYKKNPTADFVKSREFDYSIIVVGENPKDKTEGDKKDLEIPKEGFETIKNVCNDVRCAVVLISGKPLQTKETLKEADAVVETSWVPAPGGQGVADVLFGDYPFAKKKA